MGTAIAVAGAPQTQASESHENGAEGEPGKNSWSPTIAKAFNFAALVAILAYFLKAPFVTYLHTRRETIRKDLVDAAALRSLAEQQLAEVRTRLAALPAELDALRHRGQAEMVGERARLADATAREKQRVLDHTRRDIDLQLRVARRQLLEHSADLAMTLARTRIEREITSDDQTRLIDQYAATVQP